MRSIDEFDVQIMNLLKINARIPLSEMSDELGIAESELTERIEYLEEAGYIKGYHADVSMNKLGYKIKAFIMISVLPQDQHKFYDFIRKKQCVLECTHITGEFSMLMKVVFPSTTDLDTFIGELQEFGRTETQVVFSTVFRRH